MRELCRAQAADRGLAHLIAVGHRDPALRELNRRAYAAVTGLADAAKATGDLRADFTEDLVLLLIANAALLDAFGPDGSVAVERMTALTLDGWREASSTPAPPPVTPRAMLAAMHRR